MQIRNLSKVDQVSYLKAIETLLKISLATDPSVTQYENHYQGFESTWGEIASTDSEIKLAANYVACLYYLLRFKTLRKRKAEVISFQKLHEEIANSSCVHMQIEDDSLPKTQQELINIITETTDLSLKGKALSQLVKLEIEELEVGKEVRECIEQCQNNSLDKDGLNHWLEKFNISFSSKLEVNKKYSAYSLFKELLINLAAVQQTYLEEEMLGAPSLLEKHQTLRKMITARNVAKQYDADTTAFKNMIVKATKALREFTREELTYIQSIIIDSTSFLPENGIIKSVKSRLCSILVTTFENGVYDNSEYKEKKLIIRDSFNQVKRIMECMLKEGKPDFQFLRELMKFVSFAQVKTFTTFSEEELKEMNLTKQEYLLLQVSQAEQDRVLHRLDLEEAIGGSRELLESGKSRVKARWGKIGQIEKLLEMPPAEFKSQFVNVEPEEIKTLHLICYYQLKYYKLLLWNLSNHSEIQTLFARMRLFLSLATRMESAFGLSVFAEHAQEAVAIEQETHAVLALDVNSLKTEVTTKINQADDLFKKGLYFRAANLYMECWNKMTTHPELMAYHVVMRPSIILMNAARTYREIKEYAKALECFRMVLQGEVSLEELFEIGEFLTLYIEELRKKQDPAFISMQATRHLIEKRISNDVPNLRRIVIYGPKEWQKQAYTELEKRFKANQNEFTEFAVEVSSKYIAVISALKHHYANGKNFQNFKKIAGAEQHFMPYHQAMHAVAKAVSQNQIKLPVTIPAASIRMDFHLFAVDDGNPNACYYYATTKYDEALKKSDESLFLDVARKLSLVLASEEWCNDLSNKDRINEANQKLKFAREFLNNRHKLNPLKFVPGEREALTPDIAGDVLSVETALQNVKTPASPMTPRTLAELISKENDDVEEGHLSDDEVIQEGIVPANTTVKPDNKRKRNVAFGDVDIREYETTEDPEDFDPLNPTRKIGWAERIPQLQKQLQFLEEARQRNGNNNNSTQSTQQSVKATKH